ncbi:hypothetical protein BDZ89DRAFT_1131002 [Hymenopellis radicata]|nr:hypothetical protein BDZ89DRAFT_1131002 [Hymenopellis radicata]
MSSDTILGILFNAVLVGVVFMQWVAYFSNKFDDPWPLQLLVYWTMTLDIAHSAISWEYLWMYTVEHFGDTAALSASHWEYTSGPWFIVLTAVPIQIFLAWRIRKMLTGKPYHISNILFGFTVTLSVIQAIFGLYMSTSILTGAVKTTEDYKGFITITVVWEAFALATDTVIMVSSIATLLYRRTGFQHTDWLIFNLILVAVECAIPVTLFTVGHVTAVIVSPTTGIHQLFAWSQARLYSNTLFLNLNSRERLRKGNVVSTTSADPHAVNILTAMERGTMNRGTRGPEVHIDVTREEHYAMDEIHTKLSDSDVSPTPSLYLSFGLQRSLQRCQRGWSDGLVPPLSLSTRAIPYHMR